MQYAEVQFFFMPQMKIPKTRRTQMHMPLYHFMGLEMRICMKIPLVAYGPAHIPGTTIWP